MRWGLIVQDLVFDDSDFKFDIPFKREPMKRSQYGRNMLSLSSSYHQNCCSILDQIKTFQGVFEQPDNTELQPRSNNVNVFVSITF